MSSNNSGTTYDWIDEEWETVYAVHPLEEENEFKSRSLKGATFYLTYGGGPSGGYIVLYDTVWKAHKEGAFDSWTLDLLPAKYTLEFEEENDMEGKEARCRIVETTHQLLPTGENKPIDIATKANYLLNSQNAHQLVMGLLEDKQGLFEQIDELQEQVKQLQEQLKEAKAVATIASGTLKVCLQEELKRLRAIDE